MLYLSGVLFTDQIVSVFNRDNDPQLLSLASRGVQLYFTVFLIMGINIVTVSFFSSTARPVQSFVLSILRGFAAVIPFAAALPAFFGLDGAWLCIPAAEAVTLLLSVVLVKNHI